MMTGIEPLPHPFRRQLPSGATIDRWTAPDGWPLRRFRWPADQPASGSILFLGGRGDIFEKYLETFDHWHRRGWSIVALDWRGHGGSGRLTPDSRVGHLASFTALQDDLAAFWRDWNAAGPGVVMGHSMGGNVVGQALLSGAIAADGAVLLSPMVRIRSPFGAWLTRRLVAWQCRRGDPGRGAWKPKDGPAARADSEAMLTGDRGRLLDEHWWHERMPGLRLGPPSWGWLAAAINAGSALEKLAREAPPLTCPVLVLSADGDRLTDSRTTRRCFGHRRDVRSRRFADGAAHELLREIDPIRDAVLAEIDVLLDQVTDRRDLTSSARYSDTAASGGR